MPEPAKTPFAVGDTLPPRTWMPTEVQLFLFSAATWNSHRIHYDREYARQEGYPDVLVQSHLHAAVIADAVRSFCGAGARLTAIGWQNRGPAVPGDTLSVTGTVTRVEHGHAGLEVAFEFAERNQRDELCVTGTATALVPEG